MVSPSRMPLRTTISRVDRAVRASPLAKMAMASSMAGSIATFWSPKPRGSVRARWSRVTRSSWVRAWRTNTLHRESSAPLISKEGFSVVAPMRRMLPFSTKGRKASCWALLKRWISSTKTMVRSPNCRLRSACCITERISLIPLVTAEKSMNSDFVVWAMIRAKVVFPTPGGPQKIMEEIWSRSISWRRTFPGPSKCCCPTYSANVRGRSRAARGWVSSRANRLCCCMAASFPGIVPYCLWCYPITEGGWVQPGATLPVPQEGVTGKKRKTTGKIVEATKKILSRDFPFFPR